ncbi:MAG: GDP-mannose 4,6-dehydratase, partial [Gammaproteobacteria bacterium]|nr:GDP-mannose 4,6-dehydratase [Gammaproteobacteria bacterium]
VRLSNVYGSALDHADRVVPAFARAAAEASAIRIDGAECIFDFTHIDDTVRGIIMVIDQLDAGEAPPPLHLLTGTPTTLRELAELALSLAGSAVPITVEPPRAFDVARFYGDPSLARKVLGWTPRIALRQGLAGLVRDFRVGSESMASAD